MPSDPSIYGGLQPLQPINPLAILAQVHQMKALQADQEHRRAEHANDAERRAYERDHLAFQREQLAQQRSTLEAKDQTEKADRVKQSIVGLLGLPDEPTRAQQYAMVRQQAVADGLITPEQAPEQYPGEAWLRVQLSSMVKPETLFESLTPKQTPPALMNLGGGIVFDPVKREVVYQAPKDAMADKAPSIGSFEDYVLRKFGETPTATQIEVARKAYMQADDRPRQAPIPIVVMTDSGPSLVNRNTGTATPVKGPDGKPVGFAPTAEQRNREVATDRARPVLDSIGELSERINTQRGIVARMAGGAAKVAAQANLNDDVSEYQALVSGFTPMLARMVGHVGVLTEQDVQSVRTMLPQPGDSKNVRDRKMARINKILGEQQGQATTTQQSAGGGKTMSRAQLRAIATKHKVSEAEAERQAKAQGYTVK